ncbi:hypothetical protein AAIB33_14745 [Microbacterium sp. AZCO]|uniref:DUF7507 domain-containing protein n=1 Tax=Microbacterium sp. AZCO TaxID=3142976 RepID=UPI0031F43A39
MAIALVVSGLGAVALPAAADPPVGGSPVVAETFTGSSVPDPAWTVQGAACLTGAPTGAAPPAGGAQIPSCQNHAVGPVPTAGVTPGYLQLTDAQGNQAGSALYNRPIPATAGISVTFEQYQYGGNGADGIGFFLVDGSTSLTATGGLGGSLGYAQRFGEPGVVGGYLGVGLDAYGNYYDDGENRGAGCPAGQRSPTTATGAIAPNVITLRGPGSGTTGYCWLDSTVPKPITNPTKPGTSLNGGSGTLRAASLSASLRTVNVQVTPVTGAQPIPRVIVQVQYTPGGPWVTELDIPAPQFPPTTYKLGFSASTGGQNDVHLIRTVAVQTVLPLDELNVEKQVDQTGAPLPAVITAGTVIPYQYTVTNSGAPVSALSIADDRIPSGIVCQATALTTAPDPGSTTTCRGSYTVTAADVAAGTVVNTATANATSSLGSPVTTAPVSVTVPLTSSIALTKSVQTAPPYRVGQQVTYTYTVTNTGDSVLRGPVITDNRIPVSAISCASGVVAPGGNVVCTGRYTVAAGDIGADGRIVNTATVAARTAIGQQVTSAPAQAAIPVATDVAVTKTIDNPAPLVGQNVTFTVTATGNGPATATNVVVTDVIPTGSNGPVVYVSSTTSAGTAYDPATGRWTIPSLPPGTTVRLTITVTVNTTSPYTNSAARTSTDQPDRNSSNDSAAASINPTRPTMDISVAKSVDRRTVPLGGSAIFTVVATNNGPFSGTGVLVSDLLPSGLTFDAAASGGDGTYDPTTGVWNIGALAVGQSATRRIAVTASTLGTYTNLAALAGIPSPADINSANNASSASIEVVLPTSDLAVVKGAFPNSAVVGEDVTYQLTASNLGPDAASNVTVTDLFPPGITVLSATATRGNISADGTTWTIGSLGVGEQGVTATVTARIDAPGTQVNTATIDSAQVIDPDESNNSSSAAVVSGEPDLDIAVGKSVSVPSGASPNAVPLGEDVVFTLTAANDAGGVAATDLVVTDQLPAGFTFVSSAGDGAFDPVTGSWTIPSVAAGGTAQRTITARVTAPGSYVNIASLASVTQNDSNPSNNSGSATVTAVVLSNVSISKSVVVPPGARPGDVVRYTIAVSNAGPNDATGVVARDPLLVPAVIENLTVDTGTYDPASRVWSIGDLADGATATMFVDIRLTRIGVTRNTVAITGIDQSDPDQNNNTAVADLVIPAADIALTKTVDKPQAYVGDAVTFTVGVWNYGPNPAGPVVVDDMLPVGLTFVSASASAGSYDPATGEWTLPDLAPANPPAPDPQETLTIVARVDAEGVLTNTASSDRAAPAVFDPDPTNDSASVPVTASVMPAELHVTKSVDPASVQVGGAVTYTIGVSNSGPADAADVELLDTFPDGLTPTGTSTAGCAILASTLSCDLGTLGVGESVDVVVTAVASTTGEIVNSASASSSTPLTAGSTVTASAVITAVSAPQPPDGGTPPDGGAPSGGGAPPGGGSSPLPATGGGGAGQAPLVAVLLVASGLLLAGWRRHRRSDRAPL